jgi:hypothetical protein
MYISYLMLLHTDIQLHLHYFVSIIANETHEYFGVIVKCSVILGT